MPVPTLAPGTVAASAEAVDEAMAPPAGPSIAAAAVSSAGAGGVGAGKPLGVTIFEVSLGHFVNERAGRGDQRLPLTVIKVCKMSIVSFAQLI